MNATPSGSGKSAAAQPSLAEMTFARLGVNDHQVFTFPQLTAREYALLDGRPTETPPPAPDPAVNPDGTRFSQPSIADEPCVRHTNRDLFGLALSGGGIRSATFNLGLLQSLARKNLLGHLHYLSTVSGGGYVGGFWTAWRHRNPNAALNFPVARAATPPKPEQTPEPRDLREPAPIRHLREFSRFLMPRVGFFHSETWDGIVTILGGTVPALAGALAVLVFVHLVWLAVVHWLACCNLILGGLCSPLFLAIVTAGVLLIGEFLWRHAHKRGATDSRVAPFFVVALGATGCAVVLWLWWLDTSVYRHAEDIWPVMRGENGLALRPELTDSCGKFSVLPFGPSLVWLATALLLLAVRALRSGLEGDGEKRSAYLTKLERAAARLIATALIWALLAAIWSLAFWLSNQQQQVATASSGALAVASGLLFVWLRDWLGKPPGQTNAGALLARVSGFLKPLAPQLLANAAVLLLLLLTALIVEQYYLAVDSSWLAFTAAGVLLATLFFFDPHRVGMHDFYRSRIARCFLGAARAEEFPGYRRYTSEQAEDELRLRDLSDPHSARPPIHLVCTTANNLAGDVLGSLYRGGRSAVISPFGLSLGNHTGSQPDLRLSAALTASAAAFNSQMGSFSVRLGPAVAFLMCAFNLRLGLWRPHPANPFLKTMAPGFRFFFEMAGRTNCDPLPPDLVQAIAAPGYDFKKLPWLSRLELTVKALHLSDGGHFENLALYELVRRHCRYVIVSDCGADPEVAFDDLANAQRRVREDFGVEIEIDVTPLRPDERGRSRQHAVVGTIHYDGYEGSDKGTLIYFKPTLTGDEPPDVLQYRARNTAFPHESTGDQFYDEPQWEAYRRLGQHVGNVVFRFTENYPPDRHETSAHFVENIFLDAARNWHAAPERQSEVFLALTERCAALENDLRQNAPERLRAEFFPEAFAAMPAAATPASQPTASENSQTLYYLMLVAQVMEDVWLGAELDLYWSHPLNDGWMNYFHRWASTPSFRRWWPVIRPIFSLGFRDFVRDRFQLTYAKEGRPGARLELHAESGQRTGLAWNYWNLRGTPVPAGTKVLEFHLTLDAVVPDASLESFPVGLLFYTVPEVRGAAWNAADFFVPPSLNGSGIAARFLSAIIERLAVGQHRALTVTFTTDKRRADPASRLHQLHDMSFYKSRGFVTDGPPDAQGNYRLVRPAGK